MNFRIIQPSERITPLGNNTVPIKGPLKLPWYYSYAPETPRYHNDVMFGESRGQLVCLKFADLTHGEVFSKSYQIKPTVRLYLPSIMIDLEQQADAVHLLFQINRRAR